MPDHDTPPLCFGLDRPTDEASLVAFINRFAQPALLDTLIPRMADGEIIATLDFLTHLMRNHLNDTEYHRLFLAETP
ncbi:MAG: hypothetical protein AB1413_11075 [Thermodesulfobacteriota bacterium]